MKRLVLPLLLLLALPAAAFGQPVSGEECPDEAASEPAGLGDIADAVGGAMDAEGLTLAPDGYVRNVDAEDAPESLREAAERAARLPVPYRVQEGPTCGLYALGMVMDYWHSLDPSNEAPYVVDKDAYRRGAANYPATTDRRIFDVAKDNGYFAESLRIVGEEGGMFVADELGQLGTKFGYGYRRIDDATAADVRAVVDRGHPALVGFDVDYDGNPQNAGGDRAHWGVVVGHFEYEGEAWFIAQHGWEAKTYLWRADALEASMAQIQPTLGPKIIEVFPRTH